jgi:hypothetical protein
MFSDVEHSYVYSMACIGKKSRSLLTVKYNMLKLVRTSCLHSRTPRTLSLLAGSE